MSPVSKRNVVITGADGFIGSHLTEACVRAGAEVTALSCYSSFDTDGWLDDVAEDIKGQFRIVRGDVRDADQMRSLMVGAEIVMHLAALIAIPFSYDAPSAYVQTNVQGSLNVFMAARDAGVARVVHTSTSEVYGTAQFTPITEHHPLVGQSPYSASKIGADKMAEAMHCSFELPVVILRPFNTYGPRQSQRAVIPTIIRQALDPRCQAISLGDLSTRRDFSFVFDIVNAFAAAAGPDACSGNSYNVGTGQQVTVADVVDEVKRQADCDKPVIADSERLRPTRSEVRVLEADYSRFEAATGWRPQHNLVDGLAATIDWWRMRPLESLNTDYRV